MKKGLKNNKVLIVLAVILLICFVSIGLLLFKYFYSGDNTTNYGDRLESKEKYELKEGLDKEIKALYEESEIDKVTIKVNGKIVYLTLNLSEIKTKDQAKNLALKALDGFSEEEKGYYDIQFIITCEKEETSSAELKLYPTMGYKNSTSSVVVWIKD